MGKDLTREQRIVNVKTDIGRCIALLVSINSEIKELNKNGEQFNFTTDDALSDLVEQVLQYIIELNNTIYT